MKKTGVDVTSLFPESSDTSLTVTNAPSGAGSPSSVGPRRMFPTQRNVQPCAQLEIGGHVFAPVPPSGRYQRCVVIGFQAMHNTVSVAVETESNHVSSSFTVSANSLLTAPLGLQLAPGGCTLLELLSNEAGSPAVPRSKRKRGEIDNDLPEQGAPRILSNPSAYGVVKKGLCNGEVGVMSLPITVGVSTPNAVRGPQLEIFAPTNSAMGVQISWSALQLALLLVRSAECGGTLADTAKSLISGSRLKRRGSLIPDRLFLVVYYATSDVCSLADAHEFVQSSLHFQSPGVTKNRSVPTWSVVMDALDKEDVGSPEASCHLWFVSAADIHEDPNRILELAHRITHFGCTLWDICHCSFQRVCPLQQLDLASPIIDAVIAADPSSRDRLATGVLETTVRSHWIEPHESNAGMIQREVKLRLPLSPLQRCFLSAASDKLTAEQQFNFKHGLLRTTDEDATSSGRVQCLQSASQDICRDFAVPQYLSMLLSTLKTSAPHRTLLLAPKFCFDLVATLGSNILDAHDDGTMLWRGCNDTFKWLQAGGVFVIEAEELTYETKQFKRESTGWLVDGVGALDEGGEDDEVPVWVMAAALGATSIISLSSACTDAAQSLMLLRRVANCRPQFPIFVASLECDERSIGSFDADALIPPCPLSGSHFPSEETKQRQAVLAMAVKAANGPKSNAGTTAENGKVIECSVGTLPSCKSLSAAHHLWYAEGPLYFTVAALSAMCHADSDGDPPPVLGLSSEALNDDELAAVQALLC